MLVVELELPSLRYGGCRLASLATSPLRFTRSRMVAPLRTYLPPESCRDLIPTLRGLASLARSPLRLTGTTTGQVTALSILGEVGEGRKYIFYFAPQKCYLGENKNQKRFKGKIRGEEWGGGEGGGEIGEF